MNVWQPIETKPEMLEALLYYPPAKNQYGQWKHNAWITVGRNDSPRKATRWMPLPEPPADG